MDRPNSGQVPSPGRSADVTITRQLRISGTELVFDSHGQWAPVFALYLLNERVFDYGPIMTTHSLLHERRCIECQSVVMFPGMPSNATCPQCRLRMYLNEYGGIGATPERTAQGGIQGRRRPWHPSSGFGPSSPAG
jgi:hypothetical protein